MNNTKKMNSRLLSVLLVLILCLGILPSVAFAEDGGTRTQTTVDESRDTSTTQVIGVLQTDKETYDNTPSIHDDPAWTTDDGNTYKKIVYDLSDTIKVDYSTPCPPSVQTLIDNAKSAVDSAGGDYNTQLGLSYECFDPKYTDKVTDNRKYQWFIGGTGPYPDLVDSNERYMLISQDYGRERVYKVVGVIGTRPQEIDYTLVLFEGKGYKNSTDGDEINLADFNIGSDSTGSGYIYIFNRTNYITSAPVAMRIEDEDATIDLINGFNIIISGGSDTEDTYGIEINGDIEFAGEASLCAIAGNSGKNSYGIFAKRKLTIHSGSIEGNSGASERNNSIGINADDFTVNGGTVAGNAVEAGQDSIGISSSEFTVNGGNVTGNGGVSEQNNSIGINADDFTVNDGNVVAEGDKAANTSLGAVVPSDFTIIGGEVTLIGNTLASADSDHNPKAPKTRDASGINVMGVIAGSNVDGSDAADVTDWVGDGSDDVELYKHMQFIPNIDNVPSEEPVAGKATPKTGDTSNIALWIALMFIFGCGVAVITVIGKKKKGYRA